MMYLLRWAVVSFGVFFLLYASLSLIVAISWRIFRKRLNATALFTMRVLPLFCASAIVLLVAVPSFFYLEPNSAEEGVGLSWILMALGGRSLIVIGVVSVVAAWTRTSRVRASCAAKSRQLRSDVGYTSF